MMSHEQIMSLSRRMARENRHREPAVMDDWDLSGDVPLRAALRKMPFLGVTRRVGYKVVDPVKDGAIPRRGWCKEPFLMVGKYGDGDEGSVGMTDLMKVAKHYGKGCAFWIAEEGQFQIVVAVAKKREG